MMVNKAIVDLRGMFLERIYQKQRWSPDEIASAFSYAMYDVAMEYFEEAERLAEKK